MSKISPQNPKSDRCEELFTLLDFGPQIPNLIILISTISIYQNRSISIFPIFGARVGYEKNIVYIVIHTHVLVPGLRWEKNRKSSDSISYSTIFNNFTGKMNAKPARSQLDRSQTHISQFLFSDYGDPIVNRTVPYGTCFVFCQGLQIGLFGGVCLS